MRMIPQNQILRVFLTVLFCLTLTASLAGTVKAQTNPAPKVEGDQSRKWEYCVIFRSVNEVTEDKKRTIGIVFITFLEEAGYRDEAVRFELENQGVQASE